MNRALEAVFLVLLSKHKCCPHVPFTMPDVRVQNSHEGLFLPNVPRGVGRLENMKAVAWSFNEVNPLKPGEVRLHYTWKHFDYGISFKRSLFPPFWAVLHWEIELHLYIQANFTALLRAESIRKHAEAVREGACSSPSPPLTSSPNGPRTL